RSTAEPTDVMDGRVIVADHIAFGSHHVSPCGAASYVLTVTGVQRLVFLSYAPFGRMRILVYTGKGGVGKTSVAAATAVRCAALGYRTIVISTDLAHSLADSLDVSLGPDPRQVAPHLWAQETDIYNNLQTHWGDVQKWL